MLVSRTINTLILLDWNYKNEIVPKDVLVRDVDLKKSLGYFYYFDKTK